MSEDTENLNITRQVDLIDIYRILHSKIAEYMF